MNELTGRRRSVVAFAKRWPLGVAVALVSVLSAGAALAAADLPSNYFVILNMDNDDSNNPSKDALTVYAGSAAAIGVNPAKCTGSLAYAAMDKNATSAAQSLMNKMLVSAFTGGRKVRLKISGNVCSKSSSGPTTLGVPVFIAVSLDSGE